VEEINCDTSIRPLEYDVTVNNGVIDEQFKEYANKLSVSGNYTLLVTGYFQ
jgi:hypothetical protein